MQSAFGLRMLYATPPISMKADHTEILIEASACNDQKVTRFFAARGSGSGHINEKVVAGCTIFASQETQTQHPIGLCHLAS